MAMLSGVILLIVGVLVAGPSDPASNAGQAVVASIGIALVLIGSILVLGVAKLWVIGQEMTWSRAVLGGALSVLVMILTFAVAPSWWLQSMRDLGPAWAKDLVSLVYLVALFAAGGYLLRGPVGVAAGSSGVSAYGRTLVKGGDRG